MQHLRHIDRRTRLSAATILTLGSVISLPAHSSVVYLSRSSSISSPVCTSSSPSTCTSQEVTDTSFDSFSQSLGIEGSTGYAQQQSQLSQSGITVSMLAEQSLQNYFETGTSKFSVTFNVTTPTSFVLTGNTGNLRGSASSSIAFSGPPCSFMTWPPCSQSGMSGHYDWTQISQSGILQPGDYTFSVNATANGPPYFSSAPSASATASLALSPVPLPASSVLFGTGLALLMLLRLRPTVTGRVFGV